jgi:hypothetical protein
LGNCAPRCDDDVDFEPNKLGRDFDEAIVASFRPAILNYNGACLDPAELAQPLLKIGNKTSQLAGVLGPKKPMVRSFSACCARAANGHVAAPPKSANNSRRRIPDSKD